MLCDGRHMIGLVTSSIWISVTYIYAMVLKYRSISFGNKEPIVLQVPKYIPV